MSSELDLTFLTPDEIAHLRNVLDRAKQVEQNHGDKAKLGNKEISSHEIFKGTRKKDCQDFRTGREVVSDALNIKTKEASEADSEPHHQDDPTSTQVEPIEDIHEEEPAKSAETSTTHNEDIHEEEPAKSAETSTTNDEDQEPEKEHEIKQPSKEACSENTVVPNENKVEDVPTKTPTKEFSPKKTLVKPIILIDDENLSDVNSKENEEKNDRLSPLPPPREVPESPSRFDVESMMSRTSDHNEDFVGVLQISLAYYPPDKVKQHDFPSTGTRFSDNTHLDVLTRKNYSALSGAKIPVLKESYTGAKSEDDGELHLLVSSAADLQLPSVMKKNAKTYVKCYLLPDRYHGSKMRSDEVKDSLNPKYNHIFVFRGFSEAEFNERGIEIVIGGIVSTFGRHLVIGGNRLSDGKQNPEKPEAWKSSNENEAKIWNEAFAKPCTEVHASLALRPHIKLTYK